MFGHHDDEDTNQPQDNAAAEPVQETPPGEEAAAAEPSEQPAQDGTDAPDQAVIQPEPEPSSEADESAAPDGTGDSSEPAWQHPGSPLEDKTKIEDVISPAGGFPKRPSYHYASAKSVPDVSETPQDDPVIRELIDVKEHALDELAPLLDKLNLPPEEKFRAIMMILQSNDDKSLVKAAYDAAHAIEDEEARAKALYTIVNEVDYFTHPSDQPDQPEA